MKLSIIIPCYNGASTLGSQLEALALQSWDEPCEVILADNGSTDDSVRVAEMHRERLPNLRTIDASEKRGGAFARNKGASVAGGEWLAFCDADDVVHTEWIAAIGDALKKHDFVASRFEFEQLNSNAVAKVRRNTQSEGLQQSKNPPFLPHSGGCGLAIKKALHEELGGFDESFYFLHDTDYCWRAQLKGIELHFAREAIVHVRFRDTPLDIFRQARNQGEYNVLLYARYRVAGMPQVAWAKDMKGWVTLVRGVPQLRSEIGPLKWMRHLGWRIGRLQGSVKYRVLAP